MLILAIDTATDACSAALYDTTQKTIKGTAKNRAECFELCPAQHTEKILPQINQLVSQAGIELKDLDGIAFGQGPGSFTGLRIAVSIAQALGFGLQKPLLPVSTLRAIAQADYEANGHRQVVPTLDARLQAVYWGLYQVNADDIMMAIQPDAVGPEADITIPDAKTWTVITGQYPHALTIAHLGAYDLQQGHFVSAETAVPHYVRDNVV